jgi:hypothetical protein
VVATGATFIGMRPAARLSLIALAAQPPRLVNLLALQRPSDSGTLSHRV